MTLHRTRVANKGSMRRKGKKIGDPSQVPVIMLLELVANVVPKGGRRLLLPSKHQDLSWLLFQLSMVPLQPSSACRSNIRLLHRRYLHHDS